MVWDGGTHAFALEGRPTPILIASDSHEDSVVGLYAGADDYITKPFDLDEVVARIRARIREHGGGSTRTEHE